MSEITLTNAALQDRMDAMQREVDEARQQIAMDTQRFKEIEEHGIARDLELNDAITVLERYVSAYPAFSLHPDVLYSAIVRDERERLMALETEAMAIIARAKG